MVLLLRTFVDINLMLLWMHEACDYGDMMVLLQLLKTGAKHSLQGFSNVNLLKAKTWLNLLAQRVNFVLKIVSNGLVQLPQTYCWSALKRDKIGAQLPCKSRDTAVLWKTFCGIKHELNLAQYRTRFLLMLLPKVCQRVSFEETIAASCSKQEESSGDALEIYGSSVKAPVPNKMFFSYGEDNVLQ